jgi:putative transposase
MAQAMGRSRFRFGESPFPHFLWQEGSHPKVIENEQMLRQKLESIHQNAAKRGYLSNWAHWRYSRARNDARIEALVSASTDW